MGSRFYKGMLGLGDNIYQRAVLQQIKEPTYLITSWPELYEDLPNIKPVKPVTKLRTQKKNADKYRVWHREPNLPLKTVAYRDYGILRGLQQTIGVKAGEMTLPDFGESPVSGDYIVVRPVTIRKEWRADSRNPLPEYIDEAVEALKQRGIKVVSVADLEDKQEWSLSRYKADIEFHKGELSVKQLMALCANARGIVGGVGWIVPASMAYKVPSFIVMGGWGHFNHPGKLGYHSSVLYVMPDNFCECSNKYHQCQRAITNFSTRLSKWIDTIQQRQMIA